MSATIRLIAYQSIVCPNCDSELKIKLGQRKTWCDGCNQAVDLSFPNELAESSDNPPGDSAKRKSA